MAAEDWFPEGCNGHFVPKNDKILSVVHDARRGAGSGIHLESDVPIKVFSGDGEDWQTFVKTIKPGILFIDEDYPFIHSREIEEVLE